MNAKQFLSTVEQEGHIPRPDAERATRATLTTLAERLSAGEARDVAEQLPSELRPWLTSEGGPEPFHVDEFLRRVAEREQVDPTTAERHARAVMAALGHAVSPDELHDMASELPKDFEPLLAVAKPRPGGVTPVETFVAKVADRAGLDRDGAVRTSEAVLETLGERISRGEVEDLATQLPPELRRALERGDARSSGAARKMSLDEFLQAVAEREGLTPEEAREHTRAVFATLREAVSPKEFADMTAQLPDEFTTVLARP
jgi:uncharacterized protein (DUF2267 family)